MSLLLQFVDICLHLPKHLNGLANDMGAWLYVLMFVVVFCETGLVVTPFLPGDSLLFALGALAATNGSQLNLWVLAGLLIVAAILGDAVNYWAGHLLGPKVFHYENSRLLNKKHLLRAHAFYERHGGKTIVLARFVPIVRTFAPFVAGVAEMGYTRFWQFNCVGGIAWVLIFLFGGYYFGTIPIVQQNFHVVAVAIVVISVLPMGIEWLLSRRRALLAEPLRAEAAPDNVEAEI